MPCHNQAFHVVPLFLPLKRAPTCLCFCASVSPVHLFVTLASAAADLGTLVQCPAHILQ
jgi:hypothetical protein